MQTDKKRSEDVTDEIIKLYKKSKRQRRYEYKKTLKNGLINYGNEDDFTVLRAVYKMWLEEEEQKRTHEALHEALEDLRRLDPFGYRLIIGYYFCNEKVSYTQLGKMNGISRQACSKRIRKCLNTLKVLVKLHKSQ